MKNKAELKLFLKSVLLMYDGALVTHKNKMKARKSVIDGYSDLHDWLYNND